MLVAATSAVPSGFVIETLRLQQAGPTLQTDAPPGRAREGELRVLARNRGRDGDGRSPGRDCGARIGGDVVELQRGRADRKALRIDEDRVRACGRERLDVDVAAARAHARRRDEAVPSGFVIETLRLPVVDVPIVTPLTFRLMRRPAVPAKVSFAFWPGIVVVTVTGAPPARDGGGQVGRDVVELHGGRTDCG